MKSNAEKEKYRAIFEQAGESIVLIDVETGELVEFNDKAHQNLEYGREEFKNLKLSNLEVIESAKEITKHFDEIIKKGSDTFETKHRTKNGNIRDVLVNSKFISFDGKKIFLSMWRDITEQNKINRKLRESEELYKDLFENASDLIHSVDLHEKFIYVNKKWLTTLGYSKDEIKSLKLKDIIKKDQITHCMNIFKEVCKGEYPEKVKTVFVTKNGQEVYVEGNVNAKFKDGKFVATRGIFRDITKRNEVNQEKKVLAQKAKEDMLLIKKQNYELKRLQEKLKRYSVELEKKIKKLENKVKLTKNEQLVFWGISKYPGLSDQKLSENIKLNRSTITAIRNRLKERNFFRIINIPNLVALGYELMSTVYTPISEGEQIQPIPGSFYTKSSESNYIAFIASKSFTEFQKAVDSSKHNNLIVRHFPFQLNTIQRFFDYSYMLKDLFKIKFNAKVTQPKIVNEFKELTDNEKKVLHALVKNPEQSIIKIAHTINLTRSTILKIKTDLIRNGLIVQRIIPNLNKLNIGLDVFFHAKLNSKTGLDIKEVSESCTFLIGRRNEIAGIGSFKNYYDYKILKKFKILKNGKIFCEPPFVVKIMSDKIRFSKIDFADITAELIENNENI
ncbi:MAG: PAS domain S-box protein [Nanoarchaeota archaeon]|nr:PAS domain S-box protein [Nanoarchaeota archaeon]